MSLELPVNLLEQILSNHNNRQILLLLAKIYDLFNEPSDRWDKAKIIFDSSLNSPFNSMEKENFSLSKLNQLLGDDKTFLIDLRSSGLIFNDPSDPIDRPIRILTGIQIEELGFGRHNFWITKKSFLHLLVQNSYYDIDKNWTLGRLDNKIKFFKNLQVPNQNRRINLINEKPSLTSFSPEKMKMISINPEIIPYLHEIFKYADPIAKIEFSKQLELDEALIRTENELSKCIKQTKIILKRVSSFMLTKEFLKTAYTVINSLGDNNDINIMEKILINNPSFREKLNIHLDNEKNFANWTKSIGEVLKYKKILDKQMKEYNSLVKDKIMTLNYQDIHKLINNHSYIYDKLKKIDEKIQDIEPNLSEIEGKLKIIIKID
ncbi:MAG: hypothetical protein ACTSRP_07175 [Candidatus Helarchaeota archaeon]